jgi:tetratricopeptide (TPR) repeat protein
MVRMVLMVRAEIYLCALLASLLLAACGSAPKVSEPLLRKQAQEAETDGARRYARGDYAGAVRSFSAASQLQQSIDDPAAAARSHLNQAQAELALGQAEAALNRALRITHPDFAQDALLLQAQANLALGRLPAAQANLAAAAAACAVNCPRRASLHLLQARAALADKRAADAATHAEAALKLLQDKDEAAETGNAWRLMATARLASGDAASALPAARSALDIDRKLALPEKIARDWLLIGDIQKKLGAGDTANAYQRALDVANAAGLADIARLASQVLTESRIATEPIR